MARMLWLSPSSFRNAPPTNPVAPVRKMSIGILPLSSARILRRRRELRELAEKTLHAFKPAVSFRPVARDDDFLIRSNFHGSGMFGDEPYQSFRIWKEVVAEGKRGPLWTGLDFLHLRNSTHLLDAHNFQQVLHFRWQGSEPVNQLGGEGVDLVGSFDFG